MSAAHAELQGWRGDHGRTVAGSSLSHSPRSGGRPKRARSHHPGRRLHHRPGWGGAGWDRGADPQGNGRHRHGCGAVHRLWCLCRRLSQRLRIAVHRGQAVPSWSSPSGTAGAVSPDAPDGGPDGHRTFRRVHSIRGMSGRLSQAHQHRHDHSNEPRLSSGQSHGWSGCRGRARLIQAFVALALATLAVPSVVLAQSSPWIQLGASAVPAYFWTDPVPHGGSLDEVRVVQPTVMAHAGALGDRLRFIGTLNLEGLTIKNGELALGDWGEGFVDRRHPHTYLHEAMFSYQQTLISGVHPVELSASAGKGFAPLGPDAPTSRPPLRYPVNHHLAQI